jgi:cytochrome bd ubiquinol oxidase subunit II
MFDYETLKFIWWILVGVLIIGFALTDGWDFGVLILLPFVAKEDVERRMVINSIGPTWEGNQTWLIAAGGMLFAAWPLAYAAAFSGFYFAMLVLLFSLFLRPVGFDYRSKIPHARWRTIWDWLLFTGGLVPPIIFGVAFGNLLLGVPFQFDGEMRLTYRGGLFDLLNPFGLLAGALSLSMLIMHGAAFLRIKVTGEIAGRAAKALIASALITVLLFAIGGWWIAHGIEGYRIVSIPDLNTMISPLQKTVERVPSGWMANYSTLPWIWAFPAVVFAGALLSILATIKNYTVTALLCTGAAVACVILTAATAMFPFVMPSSLDANSSLTAWDVVATHKSLGIMLWVMIIFLPLIMAYTSWIYRVMRGEVTASNIKEDEHAVY